MTSELIDYITQIKGFENSPDKFYQVIVGTDKKLATNKMMNEVTNMFKQIKESGMLKPDFIITNKFFHIII